MRSDDVKRSKRLSLVLRHRPDSIGIELDRNGWVAVTVLLRSLNDHGPRWTRDDLDRVVAGYDKQRFEFDEKRMRIRARQGHSVTVDLDLPTATPPAELFHGTPRRNIGPILADGLDPRDRHHVHLSPDVETARRVGARRGAFVVFRVDAAAQERHGDG
ncbi:MAG: RNA 2'-phosphotransferase [Aeromicrobium sp.]|uniref:RNA 2'-phosphotransferase n=1 Tax=Aeromicrobium sp. TaxID=1871063 RepID=UPI0039E586C7